MTMRWRKSGLGADLAAGVTTLGPGLSLGYGADGSVYLDAVADAGNVDWTLGYGTYDARYAPLSHASRHASGGADPITPAMIGAVAVSDLAGYVPTSRQVIAGAGLTGGGALSGNITINVASHPGAANTVGTLVVEADRVGVALGNTSTTAAPGNHPLGGHPGYLDVTKGGTGLEITAIGRARAVILDPGGSSTALQRLEAPTGAVRYLSASDTGVISWQTISLSGAVPSVGAGWIGRVLQVNGESSYGWGLRLPNVSGPVGQALVSVGAPGGILEAQWGDVDWQYIANKPATFPPAAHTHSISQVTGLQAALDGKAAASHTHSISQVTDLQAALDGRTLAAAGGYRPEYSFRVQDWGSNLDYGRAVDRPTSDYSKQVSAELKTRAAIGAPGSGTFRAVLTVAGYSDSSSGATHGQIALGNGTAAFRTGTYGSAWGPWRQIAEQDWALAQFATKVHSHDASTVFNTGNVPVAYGGTGRDMSGLTGLVHVANGLFQHIAPNAGSTPQVLQSSGGSWILGTISGTISAAGSTAGQVLQSTGSASSSYNWGVKLPNVTGPVGQPLVAQGAPGGVVTIDYGSVDAQYITGTLAEARIPNLAISKITGLQAALDGKAAVSHTHSISQVTGLQAALDAKANASTTWQRGLNGPALNGASYDLNDASGFHAFYADTSATNKPENRNSNIIGFGLANYTTQLAARSTWFYIRQQEAGVWGPWRQIAEQAWVSANFAAASHTHAASQIEPGTFGSGWYTFPDKVSIGAGALTSEGQLAIRHASGYISFHNTDAGGTRQGYLQISGSHAIFLNANATPMRFHNNGTDRIRIEANGNVGIGYTSSQSYKLAVNGTGYFSGALAANSLTLTGALSPNDGGTGHKLNSLGRALLWWPGGSPSSMSTLLLPNDATRNYIIVQNGSLSYAPLDSAALIPTPTGAGRVFQATGTGSGSYTWGVKLPNVSGPVGQPLVAQGAPGGVVTIDYGSIDAQYITGTLAEAWQRGSNGPTLQTFGGNLNDATGFHAFYASSAATNRPPPGNGNIIGFGLSNYTTQMGFYAGDGRFFIRQQIAGTWGAWRLVATEGGDITLGTVYATNMHKTSARWLKKDIEDLPLEDARKALGLRLRRYRWIDSGALDWGWVADEVDPLFRTPTLDAVYTDMIHAATLRIVQDHETRITAAEQGGQANADRIAALERENAMLRQRLNEMARSN